MLILFLIGGLLLVSISLFVLFDFIVYLEYEEHHEDWVKDNKPSGFFWTPSGASFWRGSFSRSSLASSLLFSTPVWMVGDQKARRFLFWYRLTWWISMIGWLCSVIEMIAKRSEG